MQGSTWALLPEMGYQYSQKVTTQTTTGYKTRQKFIVSVYKLKFIQIIESGNKEMKG